MIKVTATNDAEKCGILMEFEGENAVNIEVINTIAYLSKMVIETGVCSERELKKMVKELQQKIDFENAIFKEEK